jgi:hypothetical protein
MEALFRPQPGHHRQNITLYLNYTMTGVLPAGFKGLSGPADIWVPVHSSSPDLAERWSHARR